MRRDGRKRPGFNGGIVMAAMAGGTGIQFVKPGVYEIGDDERTFDDAGAEIITGRAIRNYSIYGACQWYSVFIGIIDQ